MLAKPASASTSGHSTREVASKRADSRHWEALAGLGEVYLRQGRTNDAETQFRDALELNPDLPGPRELLGDIQALGGNLPAAIATWSELAERYPDKNADWRPRLSLYRTYTTAGLAPHLRSLFMLTWVFMGLAAINLAALAIGISTAITMAYLGAGYWALVGMPAASALANSFSASSSSSRTQPSSSRI